MKLLNVGCGHHYHPEWTNLDHEATAADIIEHDVRRGLPFPNAAFDAVYHSHVLEHFTREEGRALIGECQRVLKPGGVLRVVVPDLEGIARTYLRTLEAADRDPSQGPDHQWMTVELLDQLVRAQAGGYMAPFIQDRDLGNESFVRSRIGSIFGFVAGASAVARRPFTRRLVRELRRWRRAAAVAAVTLIEGREGRLAYREGTFRRSGEIHRWMYDRVSLAELMRDAGFQDCRVCRADESRIPGYSRYQLDEAGGELRKPDSLFLEGCKTAVAHRAAA